MKFTISHAASFLDGLAEFLEDDGAREDNERHTFAQTQPPSRPQQVTGTAEVGADIVDGWVGFGCDG